MYTAVLPDTETLCSTTAEFSSSSRCVCLDTVCASNLPDIQVTLFLDDKNRDGSQKFGLVAIQPPDAAARLNGTSVAN